MRLKKNELHIRSRRNIYNFILKNPGQHYREIIRALKINKNNVSYHLNYLVKHNLISESSEKGYTRYYAVKPDGRKVKEISIILSKSIPNDSEDSIQELFEVATFGKKEKRIINILRKPEAFMIVRFLFINKDSSKKDIGNFINKHQSTINYYLNKLIKNDIVEVNKSSRGIRYRIKNQDYIYDIFSFYFSGEEVLNEQGEPTGKIINNGLDAILRSLLDSISIPFCAGFIPWIDDKKK